MAKKRKKKPEQKPRDPFVQHLITKKQGAHGKTKKALRRQDKVDLKRESFGKVNILFQRIFG